jgi:hypothetical protein
MSEPQDHRKGGLISTTLFARIVILVSFLLTIVIVVGLVRDQLDPTGVAVALCTLLSGIVVGGLMKRPNGGGPE